MLGIVTRFEIKVTVGISSFPVNRHGDRAIFLSGGSGRSMCSINEHIVLPSVYKNINSFQRH